MAETESSSLSVRLGAAEKSVRSGDPPPTVGVVLGSGLGAFGDSLGSLRKIPYAEIPGMPRSAVAGHPGNLCLGRVGAARVACLQGRVHTYEGHPLDAVTFGVRFLARLGVRAVLLTNAAGGIATGFAPGDLMLIVDHLNLMGRNPLVGPNDDALGPRFPDMSRAYDQELADAARTAARELGIDLKQGVYAALLGPSYETPAEIRMLQKLGADAVGMSTVPEVIALRHAGVRVGAMSCITNLGAGLSDAPLDHSEVEETARRTKEKFTALLSSWVERTHAAVAS
jgi:purine-nucleoside phosphorylase